MGIPCVLLSSHDDILDAAQMVVLEVGAAHMTLDAVAAKARVSKGGLLYHFPNKEVLLKALLRRRLQHLEEARKRKCGELQKEPAREIKAYVLSSLSRSRKDTSIGASLLAAVAHDPKLLEPVRGDYQKRLTELIPSGLRFSERSLSPWQRMAWATRASVFIPSERQTTETTDRELLRLADEATR